MYAKHVKRDPQNGPTNQKRLIQIKRDLYKLKETYINQKSPTTAAQDDVYTATRRQCTPNMSKETHVRDL